MKANNANIAGMETQKALNIKPNSYNEQILASSVFLLAGFFLGAVFARRELAGFFFASFAGSSSSSPKRSPNRSRPPKMSSSSSSSSSLPPNGCFSSSHSSSSSSSSFFDFLFFSFPTCFSLSHSSSLTVSHLAAMTLRMLGSELASSPEYHYLRCKTTRDKFCCGSQVGVADRVYKCNFVGQGSGPSTTGIHRGWP